MLNRTAFFISDGTGITAGALGKLLEHFPGTSFTQVRLPFTDTLDKIKLAHEAISHAAEEDGGRPVVIMSLGNMELRNAIKKSDAYFIDLFNTFIDPLGVELQQKPLTGAGIAHSVMGTKYNDRMEAINFTPVSYTHLDVYKRQTPHCAPLVMTKDSDVSPSNCAINAFTRSTASSSLATMANPVGPHELCPTQCTP